jgi:hypothetical protein
LEQRDQELVRREQEIEAGRQRIYYEERRRAEAEAELEVNEEEEEERKECEEETLRRLREEAEERYRQQTQPQPQPQPIQETRNLDSLVREMFTALLNPNNAMQANNEQFMFDPSNNMVYFETFIGPNGTNNTGPGTGGPGPNM